MMVLLAASIARAQGQPRSPSPYPAASEPPTAASAAGDKPVQSMGTTVSRGLGTFLPVPGLGGGRVNQPGSAIGGGRPRPGTIFDPGAAGPGISQRGDQNFLDGALDPKTGWPFVFLDHFKPRPERVESFWIVTTRECPQEMGSDPWPKLKVLHFDEHGDMVERPIAELFAQTVGRPVLIQVQGSLTTPDIALGGLLWTHSWLQHNRCLPPDAVVIAFDWPSQRIYRIDYRDINEKGRRAYVAAYHLARLVQAFPAASRVCLLGQSYGGRVVPGALHLLGGGSLNSQSHDNPVCLPGETPDLHLHGVVIGAASDKNWLDPDQRFDRTLVAAGGFLNLYNKRDEALIFYLALLRSDHHRAIGRVGLSNKDFEALGPRAARYEEHDIHEVLGTEHSLLDAVANPRIGRWIAPYVWAPDPGELPEQSATPESPFSGVGTNRRARTGGR